MLNIGDQAPEFTLLSDTQEQVSLSDYRGKKVIVYFYPKADTSGCTKQACAIRDAYADITAGDALVLGISPDQPDALVKFREKYDLPFPLLSDPDHQVAEAYGVWGEKKMYGNSYFGIIRSHFAVDENGVLMDANVKVKPLTTVDLALKLIAV